MPPAIVGSDNHADVEGALVVNCATVVSGSVPTDTIVQKHCSLHVRGNLIGSLTIEEGANVLVDGSIEGKIVNRGGRLVVHHKGLTEGVVMDGPSADEADAVLKINLTRHRIQLGNARQEYRCRLRGRPRVQRLRLRHRSGRGCVGQIGLPNVLRHQSCRSKARSCGGAEFHHLRFSRAARRRRAPVCKAQCATRHQQRNRACRMGRFRQCERMVGRLCAERRHRREQARTVDGGGGPAFRQGALFKSRHHASDEQFGQR